MEQREPEAQIDAIAQSTVNGRPFDRDRLFVIFFFASYAILLYQLFRILVPFLAPLLGAAMLTLVVFPVRDLIARRVRQPSAVAMLTTLTILVTVIAPVSVLAWLVTREAAAAIPALSGWLEAQQSQGWSFGDSWFGTLLLKGWSGMKDISGRLDIDLKSVALDTVREVGNRITLAGASLIRGFFAFFFQLIVLIFALFFFLRDGPQMVARIMGLIPMDGSSKTLVLDGLDRTLVAMVRGTVVTASAQGALTGIGLAVFGVPFPVLLGFVATILAVVPFVGAALVWIPGTIYLAAMGHLWAAGGLTVWGLVAVGLIDNALRPIVIGGGAQLPATLLFLGVLGGIEVYGLIGGLISPLLIACVFAFARIYRERYIGLPEPKVIGT